MSCSRKAPFRNLFSITNKPTFLTRKRTMEDRLPERVRDRVRGLHEELRLCHGRLEEAMRGPDRVRQRFELSAMMSALVMATGASSLVGEIQIPAAWALATATAAQLQSVRDLADLTGAMIENRRPVAAAQPAAACPPAGH